MQVDASLQGQIEEEIERSVALVSSIEDEKRLILELEQEKARLLAEQHQDQEIDADASSKIQSPYPKSRSISAQNSLKSNLLKKVDFDQGKSENSPRKINWDGSLVNIDPYRADNIFKPNFGSTEERKYKSEVISKPLELKHKLPSHTSIDEKKAQINMLENEIKAAELEKELLVFQDGQLEGRGDELEMLERKVRFSQNQNTEPDSLQETSIRDYMKKCNQLVKESSKIKEKKEVLESEIESGLKTNEDKSRMIMLLREKNRQLKTKLQVHQQKFEQYEQILEHNIKLKERINSMQVA